MEYTSHSSLPHSMSPSVITTCLWMADPVAGNYMKWRVSHIPEEFVAALAEPDYGGRIDYPDNLEHLADFTDFVIN